MTKTAPTAGWLGQDRANEMRDPGSRSFADLAIASGSAVPCAGNIPLDMSDPGKIWFVESGAVDIFLVERLNGVEQTALRFLTRAGEGRLLPGVEPQTEETTLSLTAKGLPGTVLRQLSADEIGDVKPRELVALTDAWIMDVSAALFRGLVASRRLPDVLLEAGQVPPTDGSIVSARRGVVWVRLPSVSPSAGLYMDLVEVEAGDPDGVPSTDAFPLTPESWLALTVPQRLSAPLSTSEMASGGGLLPAMAKFHRLALAAERINRMLAIVDQAHLERATSVIRRVDEFRARDWLSNLLDGRDTANAGDDGSPLAKALQAVGRHEGIRFKWPKRTSVPESQPDLVDVLDVSYVRGRQVQLSSIDRWWVGDSGAMLAFSSESGNPVALLPDAVGPYRMYDTETGRTTTVTADSVLSLNDKAWHFYRPLRHFPIRPGELLRTFGNGLGADLSRFAAAGLANGLIMLLPALALGLIVNRAIPNGDLGLLSSVTTALMALAAIGALIHVLQGMVFMRVEGRIASRIEAAFWDRLLRLPISFLNKYTAGDRAMRGMTFQRLRDTVQGMTANNLLSIVFFLPSLLVIFLYDAVLGAIASIFGVLALAVTMALGLRQVALHERKIQASHRLTGVLLQFIKGISKLRVDGAEGSAYAVWARHFGEQQSAERELGIRDAHLQAFGIALPLLAAATLLAAVTLRGLETLNTGEFLVVYAAFMLFVTGVVRMAASLAAVASAVPELKQLQPFLSEVPEARDGSDPVEFLGGDLKFERVSFSYDPAGPKILNDVSFHARRGEFIAIAGHSGSGKSTLFRLALGLNKPDAGTVYYDGRDLRQLNIRQLRRKVGAVPQLAILHPQDLWDNIAGDQEHIDAESVWQAARIAHIGEDIMKMPMQMLTCVGDSQSVLSGGETQKVTIARAIAKKPRILFLDEATNSLDNTNQSRIMSQLTQLPATKIVIAHRLSTLRQADRIYVLKAGKVVEQGTYDSLNAAGGVFRELVRRQEA